MSAAGDAARVALVTGAARRVGRAIAEALAARGLRTVVHYNASAPDAADVVRAIRAAGGEAFCLQSDLRHPDAAEQLVQRVVREAGRLDVLVNSAAIMRRTPLSDVTPAEWSEILAINLRAPFFCARAAAAVMPEGGAIVNIADLAGLESWPAYIPHGISKAGVIQMTRSLARVLAPRIRVNAVAPGAVLLPDDWSAADAERLARTTPLGRIGAPADVARAVLYLLDADYVTGETLLVDGGRHVR